MKSIVSLCTLIAFVASLGLPLSAFADEPAKTDPAPKCAPGAVCVDAPVTVKVTAPKKQRVVVDGTVPVKVADPVVVTTNGQPLLVEGVVTVKGDPESPLPVRVLTDRAIPMTIVDPIELKPAPRYEFEKTWWFWTAVGLVVTGAVVGGVCGGGYCGGTHHNSIEFR